MKKLYLIRHAKAAPESSTGDDFDRPLVDKGVTKTERIVKYLNKTGTVIDLIITSPAERAAATAEIIAKGIGYPAGKIQKDRKIYDGYYDRILDVIYATPNDINNLMITGHNPTITHLANLFLNPGIEFLPTSGTVCISFDTDKWEQIPSVTAQKEFLVTPKMLKKAK
ncbi:MAG: SixA phosphatase family protein [Syntrophothermus sp.]